MHRAAILTTGHASAGAPGECLGAKPHGVSTSEHQRRAQERKEGRAREIGGRNREAFVLETLKRNGWNATRSAEETGMQRANFQALMKKYNIRLREIGEARQTTPHASGSQH